MWDAGDRNTLRRRARGIEHGRSGIIVDSYREMSDAIEEADGLEPLVCRQYAEERFAPDRMVADYLAAYRTMIE